MSYDLYVYHNQPDFPEDELREILAGLWPAEGGVRLTENGPGEWEFFVGTSVWVDVSPVRSEPGSDCIPTGARWRATSSTSMGRSVHAVWLQFAVVYHMALLLPGMTVHNCQIGEHGTYTDPEAFRLSASKSMRRLARVRLLRRFGYLGEDDQAVF